MSLDLSDRMALVTCQNKGEDALVFRTDSPFFKSYHDDFDAGWQSCRVVTPKLKSSIAISATTRLTEEHCQVLNEFYGSLDLPSCDPAELQAIVRTLGRD